MLQSFSITAGLALALGALSLSAMPASASAAYIESAELLGPNRAQVDHFGAAVGVANDVALVGAPSSTLSGVGFGSAHVYRCRGNLWVLEQTLVSSDRSRGDGFGSEVALDGDVAVVGAPFKNSDIGAVYVFRWSGSAWVQEAKLLPSIRYQGRFGGRLTVKGNVIAAGAYNDDDACPQSFRCDSGAVYVFRFDGSQWREEQRITASDLRADDQFGLSVALDTNVLAVGSHGIPDDCPKDTHCYPGAVYTFRHDGAGWVEEQKLVASDPGRFDSFGQSLAVHNGLLAAGAAGNDPCGGSCPAAGAAYVFSFDGVSWVETQKLVVSDRTAGQQVGLSLSLSTGVLVAGGNVANSAYVFRQAGGGWVEDQKLQPSDDTADDGFGYAVSASGSWILVGAPFHEHGGVLSGSAYVYGNDCRVIPRPFSFSASKLPVRSVRLQWQGDSTKIGVYNVERAPQPGGPFQLIAQVGAGARPGIYAFSYTDSTLPAQAQYCYRVQAQRVDGARGCFTGPLCVSFVSIVRGDVVLNAKVDAEDVKAIAAYLAGKGKLACEDTADVDDDGRVSTKDMVLLSQYLFEGGVPPSFPFPKCDDDPTTDALACGSKGQCN